MERTIAVIPVAANETILRYEAGVLAEVDPYFITRMWVTESNDVGRWLYITTSR